jgi:hypothetical protein
MYRFPMQRRTLGVTGFRAELLRHRRAAIRHGGQGESTFAPRSLRWASTVVPGVRILSTLPYSSVTNSAELKALELILEKDLATVGHC